MAAESDRSSPAQRQRTTRKRTADGERADALSTSRPYLSLRRPGSTCRRRSPETAVYFDLHFRGWEGRWEVVPRWLSPRGRTKGSPDPQEDHKMEGIRKRIATATSVHRQSDKPTRAGHPSQRVDYSRAIQGGRRKPIWGSGDAEHASRARAGAGAALAAPPAVDGSPAEPSHTKTLSQVTLHSPTPETGSNVGPFGVRSAASSPAEGTEPTLYRASHLASRAPEPPSQAQRRHYRRTTSDPRSGCQAIPSIYEEARLGGEGGTSAEPAGHLATHCLARERLCRRLGGHEEHRRRRQWNVGDATCRSWTTFVLRCRDHASPRPALHIFRPGPRYRTQANRVVAQPPRAPQLGPLGAPTRATLPDPFFSGTRHMRRHDPALRPRGLASAREPGCPR